MISSKGRKQQSRRCRYRDKLEDSRIKLSKIHEEYETYRAQQRLISTTRHIVLGLRVGIGDGIGLLEICN